MSASSTMESKSFGFSLILAANSFKRFSSIGGAGGSPGLFNASVGTFGSTAKGVARTTAGALCLVQVYMPANPMAKPTSRKIKDWARMILIIPQYAVRKIVGILVH